MSYEYLCSLYYGEGSNADLTARDVRAKVHVRTEIEELVSRTLANGRDVVLTGNPGDGKSHLARRLQDEGKLAGALLIGDLSERDTRDAIEAWSTARQRGRRVLLCGNEGPLRELIDVGRGTDSASSIVADLQQQLGHLVSDDERSLPPEPSGVLLIDLADRSVLGVRLIDDVLKKVSSEDFLPPLGAVRAETSAGKNLLMLQVAEIRSRLTSVLSLAGRMLGEHITFRELWAAIAWSLSAAKMPSTLRVELSQTEEGLWTSPLDNLHNPRGKGRLIEAVRLFADPARIPWPDLDEALWTTGAPPSGEWLFDVVPGEPPERLWFRNKSEEALEKQRQLKRLVALAHSQGGRLIEELSRAAPLPSDTDDDALRRQIILGVRRLFLSERDESVVPSWLSGGLPLWLGFSYESGPLEERPHVAVRALDESAFVIRRPRRPGWFGGVLGPLPEIAWLRHEASGVSLRVDPSLLGALRGAIASSGPTIVPDRVQRFLTRLAGWDETVKPDPSRDEMFAIIERPRGRLLAAEKVTRSEDGGVSYGIAKD